MRWGIVCLLLAAGCSTPPAKPPPDGAPAPVAAAATMPAAAADGVNPSFPVTVDQANQAIKEMLEHRKAFQRPVVVVGGFMDPYVLLGDEIVGQKNAAPPGRNPYWLRDRDWIQFSVHGDAMTDPRILGDIARRLRGETPFTLSPPAPLPEDGNR